MILWVNSNGNARQCHRKIASVPSHTRFMSPNKAKGNSINSPASRSTTKQQHQQKRQQPVNIRCNIIHKQYPKHNRTRRCRRETAPPQTIYICRIPTDKAIVIIINVVVVVYVESSWKCAITHSNSNCISHTHSNKCAPPSARMSRHKTEYALLYDDTLYALWG